jgi:hypothetical protein
MILEYLPFFTSVLIFNLDLFSLNHSIDVHLEELVPLEADGSVVLHEDLERLHHSFETGILVDSSLDLGDVHLDLDALISKFVLDKCSDVHVIVILNEISKKSHRGIIKIHL